MTSHRTIVVGDPHGCTDEFRELMKQILRLFLPITIPDQQLEAFRLDTIDVDVEAKHKNLALLDMCKKFLISC